MAVLSGTKAVEAVLFQLQWCSNYNVFKLLRDCWNTSTVASLAVDMKIHKLQKRRAENPCLDETNFVC